MYDNPSIYVACVATFNNTGKHFGAWIDAAQEADAINAEIQDMLALSPTPNAKEFAIADENGFGDIKLKEYESIESISELAQFIAEHGELGVSLFQFAANGVKPLQENLDNAKNYMEDHYIGQYDRVADLARELTDETAIPENIRYYIDYDKLANDMELSCDFFFIETDQGCHYFSS